MPTYDPTKPETGVTTFGNLYQILRDNLNALDQNHAGSTAPATPSTGTVWFDTTNDVLKIYDGAAWQNIGDKTADVAEVVAARGSKSSLDARLDVALNEDGSMKAGATTSDPWYTPGFNVLYASSSSITTAGDQSDVFTPGRRVKATMAASTQYLTVKSCTSAASSTVTFAEATLTDPLTSLEIARVESSDATGDAPREYASLTFDGPVILKEQSSHPSALTSPDRWQLYAYQDGGTNDGVYIMHPNGDKSKISA